MKRLMILTALAVMTVGLAGCGRNWGQWWNRGAWCGGGQPQPYSAYSPVYEDDVITQSVPATTVPVLPGPAPR